MTTAKMDVEVGFNEEVTQGLKTLQSGIIRFVGAVTAGIAAVNVVVFPIRGAIEYERSLADIAKTTGFTVSQINRVGDALLEMSAQTSRSAVDLAQIATVAGQLGLGAKAGVDGIIEFTRVIQMAATALNVAEEDAAKMGAQILNIFKFEPGQTENVLSVINELSNTSVARGEEIADIVARIGTVAGLAFPEVATLAAYAKDLGVSTEVAGTSFVKIFTRMLSSAENFSELMQISTDEWVKMVEEDAVGALQSAAAAVAKLGSADQAQTINKLFGQGRVYALTAKIVEDASNGFVLLDNHLRTANTQFIEGTSIAAEFAAVMGTTEEQIQQTKNSLIALSTSAGSQSLPFLRDMLTSIREWAAQPATQAMAQDFGSELLKILQGVRALGSAVADMNIDWSKLYDLLRLIVVYAGVKLAASILISVVKWVAGLKTISQYWVQIRTQIAGVGPAMAPLMATIDRINASYARMLALVQKISTTPPPAAFMTPGTASATGAGSASNLDPTIRAQRSINNVLLERQNLLRQDLVANQAIRDTLKTKLVQQRAILASMAQNSTATAAQISTQRNIVATIQAEIAARNRAIASTSGHIGALTKQLAIQQQIMAVTVATGKANVANASYTMGPVLTGWARLNLVLNRGVGLAINAVKAIGTFLRTFIIPTAVITGAIFAITDGVPFILRALGVLDNEQKRLAREERALEQQRQDDLRQRAEVALEVYNRIVRGAEDAQKQIERLRLPRLEETGTLDSGSAFDRLRQGSAAVKDMSNSVQEMRKQNEATTAQLAEMGAEIDRFTRAAEASFLTLKLGSFPVLSFSDMLIRDFIPFMQSSDERAAELIKQRQIMLDQIAINQGLEEEFNAAISEFGEAVRSTTLDVLQVLGKGDIEAAAAFIATREEVINLMSDLRDLDTELNGLFDFQLNLDIANIDESFLSSLDESTRRDVDAILAEYNRLREREQELRRRQVDAGAELQNSLGPFMSGAERLGIWVSNLEEAEAALAKLGVTAQTSGQEINDGIRSGLISADSVGQVQELQRAARVARDEVSSIVKELVTLGNANEELIPLIQQLLDLKSGAGLKLDVSELVAASAALDASFSNLSAEEQARIRFTREVVAGRDAEAERLRSIFSAQRRLVQLETERARIAELAAAEEAGALANVNVNDQMIEQLKFRFSQISEDLAATISKAFSEGIALDEVPELDGVVQKLGEDFYLLGETVTESGTKLAAYAVDGTISIYEVGEAAKVVKADLRDMEPAEIDRTPYQDRVNEIAAITAELEQLIAARKQASADAREGLLFTAEGSGIDQSAALAIIDKFLDIKYQITAQDREQLNLASGQVRTMKDMREEAIAQYTALKMQEETLKFASAEVRAMATAARAFADNIGSWLNSARDNLGRAMMDIDRRLQNRRVEIEIEFRNEGLDDELDKAEAEVKKRYEFEMQAALRSGSRAYVDQVRARRDADIDAAKAAVKYSAAQDEVATRTEQLREVQSRQVEVARELVALSSREGDAASKQREALRLRQEGAALDREQLRLMEELVSTEVTVPVKLDTGGTRDKQVLLFTPEQVAREKAAAAAASEELYQAVSRTAPKLAASMESFAQPIMEDLKTLNAGIEDWEKRLVGLGVPPSVYSSWRDFSGYIGGDFTSSTTQALDRIRASMEGSWQPIDVLSAFNQTPAELVSGFDTAMKDAFQDRDTAGISDRLSGYMLKAAEGADATAAAQAMVTQWNAIAEEQGLGITFDVSGNITKVESKIPEGETPEVDVTAALDVDREASQQKLTQTLEADPIDAKADLLFSETQAQGVVDKFKLTLDAEINAVGGKASGGYVQARARGGYIEAPGYAAGGRISGPGTGTSDSILSWLSNGEYVMDAWTTRVFGSKFFSVLQSIARGGLGSSVRKKLKGVVPGFASGGPVTTSIQNNSMLTQLAGSAAGGSNVVLPSETVNLNLNIGRETFSLQGPRDQVKGLVESIKSVNRGTMK